MKKVAILSTTPPFVMPGMEGTEMPILRDLTGRLNDAAADGTLSFHRKFTKQLNENTKESIQFYAVIFMHLEFRIINQEATIIDSESGLDLRDFDFIFVKSWTRFSDVASAIGIYLNNTHTNFDPKEITSFRSQGKVSELFLMWSRGLRIPNTLYSPGNHRLEEMLKEHGQHKKMVVKAVGGSGGNANYLIQEVKELDSIYKQHKNTDFVAQDFIPNDSDYRLLILGQKVRLIIKRVREDVSSHLNNTSKGANATLVSLEEFSSELIKKSESLCSSMKRTVAGVDIMFDSETGEAYFLEINKSPQVGSGAFMDEKVELMLEYVNENLKSSSKKAEKGVTTVGRAELVDFPQADVEKIPAKIDTGAYRTSVWASNIYEKKGILYYTLFDKDSKYYNGVELSTDTYEIVDVENSFGHSEKRYSIMTSIRLAGRRVRTNVTLSDRSTKTYPILIGRRILRGKFVVDVSRGEPLIDKEMQEL